MKRIWRARHAQKWDKFFFRCSVLQIWHLGDANESWRPNLHCIGLTMSQSDFSEYPSTLPRTGMVRKFRLVRRIAVRPKRIFFLNLVPPCGPAERCSAHSKSKVSYAPGKLSPRAPQPGGFSKWHKAASAQWMPSYCDKESHCWTASWHKYKAPRELKQINSKAAPPFNTWKKAKSTL